MNNLTKSSEGELIWKLNELLEENESLKKELDIFKAFDLAEVERLKQANKELMEALDPFKILGAELIKNSSIKGDVYAYNGIKINMDNFRKLQSL